MAKSQSDLELILPDVREKIAESIAEATEERDRCDREIRILREADQMVEEFYEGLTALFDEIEIENEIAIEEVEPPKRKKPNTRRKKAKR